METNKIFINQMKTNIDNLLGIKQYTGFSSIEQFPKDLGIYFIFNENNDLEYIGAANNIKKRCKQYIGPRDTGATFRYNLIQNKVKPNLSIKAIKKCSALNYKYAKKIECDYKCKFITLSDFDNKIDKNIIAYWESVCIIAYKPILNKFNL